MFKFVALVAVLAVAAARPKDEGWQEQIVADIEKGASAGSYYNFDFVPEDTSGQDSYDSAHVIQKRTFGVLENAGLGAAAAAVNTFAGSLISANEASAVAANPNNRGQNYPSQPSNYPNQQNYPSQPTNQGHF